MPIVYAHNIESPGTRWGKPPQIFPRHQRYFAPFVPVYGGLGGLYVMRGPGLNFYETENIRIPADQVDLAAATWRAKVARHNHIA